MNLLLSFAPFLAFAVLAHFGRAEAGLWAGFLTAAALVLRDRFVLRRSVKILEAGTVLLFAALAFWTTARGAEWSIPLVRLAVDTGLLAIVLASLLIGTPFTLQYAREETPPEIWDQPEFLRTNREITLAWAAAFLAMIVADAVMAFLPQVPHQFGVLATVAALYLAVRYTRIRAARAASAA